MVKVSICIPAYNNVESMERLLRSIWEQDYTDYEVIITDDSDDESIYELVRDRSQVQYYKNKNRLGSTANWNEAMSRSNGEYIKIIHHDDWFSEKSSLGKLVKMLEEHPEADLAFCGTRQVEENKSYERHISKKDVDLIRMNYRNLYLGNTIGAPSATIYRRSSGLYDENLVWLVDMEFYMGILKKAPLFIYTDDPLISIGVSKSQLTEECIKDQKINVEEYGYIYKKYRLDEEKIYRDKLIRVFIDNNAPYETAKNFDISLKEYCMGKLGKWMGKIKWKLGIRG